MSKIGKMLRMIFLICILFTSTFASTQAEELQDNNTTKSIENNNAQQNSSSTGSYNDEKLTKDANDLASSVEQADKTLEHALTGMMDDMIAADEGKIQKKTSKVMSRVYAVCAQIARVLIIVGLMTLSVPEMLAIAFPGLEPVFASIGSGRNRNGTSGGLSGASSTGGDGKRSGLLSADYYAAIGGRNGTSGGVLSGGGTDSQNGESQKTPMQIYISLHIRTIVWSCIAVVIFLTPFGLFLCQKIVSLILYICASLLKMLGGMV